MHEYDDPNEILFLSLSLSIYIYIYLVNIVLQFTQNERLSLSHIFINESI